jgi:hypothetical protein
MVGVSRLFVKKIHLRLWLLLLGILAQTWIFPVFSEGGENEKGKWRPYSGYVFVDGFLYEGSGGTDKASEGVIFWKFGVSSPENFLRFASRIQEETPLFQVTGGVLAEDGNVLPDLGMKCDGLHEKLPILMSRKDDSEQRILGGPVLEAFREVGLEELQVFFEGEADGVRRDLDDVFQPFVLFSSYPAHDSDGVVVRSRIEDESSRHDEKIFDGVDFTLRRAEDTFLGAAHHTVSSKHNLLFCPDGYCYCPQRLSGEKKTQATEQSPQWVRVRYETMTWHKLDPHGHLLDLWSEVDIDVSVDGQHWFHALGQRCFDHNPLWQATVY